MTLDRDLSAASLRPLLDRPTATLAALKAMSDRGEFPRYRKRGRFVRWSEAEVQAWLAGKWRPSGAKRKA